LGVVSGIRNADAMYPIDRVDAGLNGTGSRWPDAVEHDTQFVGASNRRST
jgi:hypothetical protein